MIDELQHRLALFLNHVLMQEPEAQARLARQKGGCVKVQWRGFSLQFCATPAGLLDIDDGTAPPDLLLTLTEESPFALAQAALRGDKPAVRVEGDVQLAAEVNWLVDHVRWDVEEDLSRLIGDAPAHALGRAARGAAQALQQFVRARPWPGADKAPA
jgi:ubiquinone biosynthesis accessory factor UbiJ